MKEKETTEKGKETLPSPGRSLVSPPLCVERKTGKCESISSEIVLVVHIGSSQLW